MSDTPKVPLATLADLLAIPEERRFHEVIDGELIEKEAASGRHGGAQMRLGEQLAPYNRRASGRWPGGCLFASETEILFEQTQVLRPDVAAWRRVRLAELPAEVPIEVLPDWVCEILSKDRKRDLVKKKRVYHRHKIGHYWIVDPANETLSVHRWHTEGYIEVMVAERRDRVRAEPFGDIELALGLLFGDEPDD